MEAKANKFKINSNKGKLKNYTSSTEGAALSARIRLAQFAGFQYNGKRDLYSALGYPTQVSFNDYMQRYLTQEIAKAVIDRPVTAAWRGGFRIKSKTNENVEKEWKKLDKTFKIQHILRRVDKLTGIGHYGALFLGLNDITNDEGQKQPVSANRKGLALKYIKPLSEGSISIDTWERQSTSDRFGLPLTYSIKLENSNVGISKTLKVHYSRIIHIVEDVLENDLSGVPRLQAIYHRLMDLDKIVGGDAEMFWRGARPGYHAKVDKDYDMGSEEEAGIEDQLEEYENDLRRFLFNEGVDIKALDQQLSDPTAHVDIQMSLISAEQKIPKRILMGSEKGELASGQDKEEWNQWTSSRREEFMEPMIVRPLVDRLMEYNLIPKEEEYVIQWDFLFALSPLEKAEVAEKSANAIRYYTATPTAEYIVPREIFLKKYLNMSDEELKEIEDLVAELPDEDELTPEEQEVVGSPISGEDTIAKKQVPSPKTDS